MAQVMAQHSAQTEIALPDDDMEISSDIGQTHAEEDTIDIDEIPAQAAYERGWEDDNMDEEVKNEINDDEMDDDTLQDPPDEELRDASVDPDIDISDQADDRDFDTTIYFDAEVHNEQNLLDDDHHVEVSETAPQTDHSDIPGPTDTLAQSANESGVEATPLIEPVAQSASGLASETFVPLPAISGPDEDGNAPGLASVKSEESSKSSDTYAGEDIEHPAEVPETTVTGKATEESTATAEGASHDVPPDAGSGHFHSDDQDYKDAFAKHAVIVIYETQEYHLFPPEEDKESDTFFLHDRELVHAVIKDLFSACKDVLGDSVQEDQVLELECSELGLCIGEDDPYASTARLIDVLEIYCRLCQNGGETSPAPLYLSLNVRHRFWPRFVYLRDQMSLGKGLSEITSSVEYDEDQDEAGGSAEGDEHEATFDDHADGDAEGLGNDAHDEIDEAAAPAKIDQELNSSRENEHEDGIPSNDLETENAASTNLAEAEAPASEAHEAATVVEGGEVVASLAEPRAEVGRSIDPDGDQAYLPPFEGEDIQDAEEIEQFEGAEPSTEAHGDVDGELPEEETKGMEEQTNVLQEEIGVGNVREDADARHGAIAAEDAGSGHEPEKDDTASGRHADATHQGGVETATIEEEHAWDLEDGEASLEGPDAAHTESQTQEHGDVQDHIAEDEGFLLEPFDDAEEEDGEDFSGDTLEDDNAPPQHTAPSQSPGGASTISRKRSWHESEGSNEVADETGESGAKKARSD